MSRQEVTVAELETRIRERVVGAIPDDFHIAADTRLTDLGLSSLTLGELLMELEDEIGMEFDSHLIAETETVGQLVNLINSTDLTAALDEAKQ